jgi:hypothetical protein
MKFITWTGIQAIVICETYFRTPWSTGLFIDVFLKNINVCFVYLLRKFRPKMFLLNNYFVDRH